MKVKYLKCTYTKISEGEYGVNFNARNQNWCFVNRADVLSSKNNQGYVKCLLAEDLEREAIVWINDLGDHRPSPFRVSKADLIDRTDGLKAA